MYAWLFFQIHAVDLHGIILFSMQKTAPFSSLLPGLIFSSAQFRGDGVHQQAAAAFQDEALFRG
ncbi:hypothetical protein, partial [Akkermansia sp.]|uniref:hypothetical protein n=1 Tax=Akkermansia sp. TaxID=1872421 RepID=UPI003AB6C14E